MRFPLAFYRYVGGAGKQLGSDEVPLTHPQTNADNQLALRLSNTNGYPIQRIVVGCQAPEGSPLIPVKVFVHDDNTERWYSVEPSCRLAEPGALTYFDLPTLADNPNVGSRDVGAIELCVIAGLPDDASEGRYTFVVGGDVSCPA
jgi:hypothetical protein